MHHIYMYIGGSSSKLVIMFIFLNYNFSTEIFLDKQNPRQKDRFYIEMDKDFSVVVPNNEFFMDDKGCFILDVVMLFKSAKSYGKLYLYIKNPDEFLFNRFNELSQFTFITPELYGPVPVEYGDFDRYLRFDNISISVKDTSKDVQYIDLMFYNNVESGPNKTPNYAVISKPIRVKVIKNTKKNVVNNIIDVKNTKKTDTSSDVKSANNNKKSSVNNIELSTNKDKKNVDNNKNISNSVMDNAVKVVNKNNEINVKNKNSIEKIDKMDGVSDNSTIKVKDNNNLVRVENKIPSDKSKESEDKINDCNDDNILEDKSCSKESNVKNISTTNSNLGLNKLKDDNSVKKDRNGMVNAEEVLIAKEDIIKKTDVDLNKDKQNTVNNNDLKNKCNNLYKEGQVLSVKENIIEKGKNLNKDKQNIDDNNDLGNYDNQSKKEEVLTAKENIIKKSDVDINKNKQNTVNNNDLGNYDNQSKKEQVLTAKEDIIKKSDVDINKNKQNTVNNNDLGNYDNQSKKEEVLSVKENIIEKDRNLNKDKQNTVNNNDLGNYDNQSKKEEVLTNKNIENNEKEVFKEDNNGASINNNLKNREIDKSSTVRSVFERNNVEFSKDSKDLNDSELSIDIDDRNNITLIGDKGNGNYRDIIRDDKLIKKKFCNNNSTNDNNYENNGCISNIVNTDTKYGGPIDKKNIQSSSALEKDNVSNNRDKINTVCINDVVNGFTNKILSDNNMIKSCNNHNKNSCMIANSKTNSEKYLGVDSSKNLNNSLDVKEIQVLGLEKSSDVGVKNDNINVLNSINSNCIIDDASEKAGFNVNLTKEGNDLSISDNIMDGPDNIKSKGLVKNNTSCMQCSKCCKPR